MRFQHVKVSLAALSKRERLHCYSVQCVKIVPRWDLSCLDLTVLNPAPQTNPFSASFCFRCSLLRFPFWCELAVQICGEQVNVTHHSFPPRSKRPEILGMASAFCNACFSNERYSARTTRYLRHRCRCLLFSTWQRGFRIAKLLPSFFCSVAVLNLNTNFSMSCGTLGTKLASALCSFFGSRRNLLSVAISQPRKAVSTKAAGQSSFNLQFRELWSKRDITGGRGLTPCPAPVSEIPFDFNNFSKLVLCRSDIC